jgi:Phage tail tube protein
MAKNKVVGRARVRIDGQLIETAGDVKLMLGGVKREAVVGDLDARSFKEMPEPAKLDFNQLVKELTDISDFDDATVTVEFDTGQVYVIRNAYVMDPAEVSTNEGKVSRSFGGGAAERTS